MEPVDVLSTLRVKREMMQSGCISIVPLPSAPGFRGVKPHRGIRAPVGLREKHFPWRLAGELVAEIAHNRLVEGPGTSHIADREIHVMDGTRHCKCPAGETVDVRRRFSETRSQTQVRVER